MFVNKIQRIKYLQARIRRFQEYKIFRWKLARKRAFQKYKKEQKEQQEQMLLYNNLNKPFILKEDYNSIIPLHLYTCWHTKDLPPLMKANYDYLIECNPEINVHLYDENDCREFIENNFELDVLNAYDSLIPCSYKSDLWRFCVLYINGGIYIDIKYSCANGFKFISLTEKEYFVRDLDINNVYTALIITLPGNEIMYKCIRRIVENVQNKFYGNGCLEPTGPALLTNYFTQEERNSMEMYHSWRPCINKYYIVKDDTIILRIYDGYRDEQSKLQKLKHYGELWNERNIYS
jgi:mannosyltransferase OCH1-like enzyme